MLFTWNGEQFIRLGDFLGGEGLGYLALRMPTVSLIATRPWPSAPSSFEMHLAGIDLTATLKAWDRRTVDSFCKLEGRIGHAKEHGVILDIGDLLSRFTPGQPLVLCLAG